MKSKSSFTTFVVVLMLIMTAQVSKYFFPGQWQLHYISDIRVVATGLVSGVCATFAFLVHEKLTRIEYSLMVFYTAGCISNFADAATLGFGVNFFKIYTNINYDTGMAYGWYFNLADVYIYGSLIVFLVGMLFMLILSKGKNARIGT